MVIREFYKTREDGTILFRTYSDKNLKIRQVETGIVYDEAIDIDNSGFTYEETTEERQAYEEERERRAEALAGIPEEVTE
jgi:hypothetical protein